MLTLRPSSERGHADHGWLESYHSFSFADYHDPEHMGFGNLRVINEDRVAPGKGFGTHSHRDMEIVSYVLEGELAHKDSIGDGARDASDGGVIRPGDVQRMSAGTGVSHSEFNHSASMTTHFLQIWIVPDRNGIAPSYEQKHFEPRVQRGALCLVASPNGAEDSVTLHADASIRIGLFDGDERVQLPLRSERLTYVHVVRGRLCVNGQSLEAGDAAMIRDESILTLDRGVAGEVLVFDLAP